MTDENFREDMGYIKASLKSLNEKIDAVSRRIDNMPCSKHGEDIRELKTRAAITGSISGLAASVFINLGFLALRFLLS